MFAALAMVSCSNEEAVTPNGNISNGEPQYLTVNINATGSLSRASDYEDGSKEENKVDKVRFYFFNADGTAASVKGTGTPSYMDVAMDGNAKEDPNVERILTATLVIQTPANDEIPSSIVAVVNPASTLGAVESIDKLNEIVADHSTTTNFIMSSSVYANGTAKMEEVSVAGHLYATPEAAVADPVTIYVERVLGKARMTVGLTATTGGGKTLYKVNKSAKPAEAEKFGEEDIYVNFLGWNVTAATTKSRLMKEINASQWGAGLFARSNAVDDNLTWNTVDYHRCFWAMNPSGTDKLAYPAGYIYEDFYDNQAVKGFVAPGSESDPVNYTYMQENASDDFVNGSDPEHPTQMIIAAQLCDKNGNVLSIAEYGGNRYKAEDLKKAFASQTGWWTPEGTGRRQITENDIELYTDADNHGNTTQIGTSNRYKVYARLTSAAAALKWYATEPATDTEELETAKLMKGMGSAKVWKNGYTYYYFDIQHLNAASTADNAKGVKGVVRNHIYDATIQSLYGLGTPVYDPTETIYPEKPNDDETYIAAEIKILSWRLVSQNIDLAW